MRLLGPRIAAFILTSTYEPVTHIRTAIRMDITVCNGGACTENGADVLLDACSVLGSGDPKLIVKTAYCSGECPAATAMICPNRGAMEAYEAVCSTLDDAIASAKSAIAAAGTEVDPALVEAFVGLREAKEAESNGDAAVAYERYAAVVASIPQALLEPVHDPMPPEPFMWEGSAWVESKFSSDLGLGKSLEASDGFGTFGGCTMLVDKKVVVAPIITLQDCAVDEGRLSGRWVDSAGAAGTLDAVMSTDGRKFEGELAYDDGSESVPWSGLRKGSGKRRQRRGEAPPSRVAWLHDSMLGRSRCALEMGEAAAAAEAARAATALCCRTATGWTALAAALEADGDLRAAKEARDEAEYLKGFA